MAASRTPGCACSPTRLRLEPSVPGDRRGRGKLRVSSISLDGEAVVCGDDGVSDSIMLRTTGPCPFTDHREVRQTCSARRQGPKSIRGALATAPLGRTRNRRDPTQVERGSCSSEGDFPCAHCSPLLLWQLSWLRRALRTTTSFRTRARSDAGSLRSGRRPVSCPDRSHRLPRSRGGESRMRTVEECRESGATTGGGGVRIEERERVIRER